MAVLNRAEWGGDTQVSAHQHRYMQAPWCGTGNGTAMLACLHTSAKEDANSMTFCHAVLLPPLD